MAEPKQKPNACPKVNSSPQLTCPMKETSKPTFVVSLACIECIEKALLIVSIEGGN